MTAFGKKFIARLSTIIHSLLIFSHRPAHPGPNDLKDADFKTSTQRMGLRFTDKVRNVFRHKWLKKN